MDQQKKDLRCSYLILIQQESGWFQFEISDCYQEVLRLQWPHPEQKKKFPHFIGLIAF